MDYTQGSSLKLRTSVSIIALEKLIKVMISSLKDLDNLCHKLKQRIKGIIEFKIKGNSQRVH